MKKLTVVKVLFIIGLITFLFQSIVMAGGSYYKKALSFYKKAQQRELWNDFQGSKNFYRDTVRMAQISLESEELTAEETKEISGIVTASQKKLSSVGDKEEYQKKTDLGYEYSMKGFAYSKAGEFKKAESAWDRALEYYKESLRLAPDEQSKVKIETEIINIERYLKEFTTE
ncbi:MAG: hypothetical protein COS99_04850 [Candidatus Omnitrophica bacterium CG07_land_8_20_14_0_80_42_15]|uniref:Uncharacterized protein n=1 Tax=Candidatus Aquitaenariimonas noxiae TaxID=1974741 RepID=A0A2J0L4T8_9BACT|nr:MAG: hypothetical protein COS99_04850 [Candidatus Omnitrophica bacterium CG07_land_8_20_14_0_80_42_15]